MSEFTCFVRKVDDGTYWIVTGLLGGKSQHVTAHSEKEMEGKILGFLRESLAVIPERTLDDLEQELKENEERAKAKGVRNGVLPKKI